MQLRPAWADYWKFEIHEMVAPGYAWGRADVYQARYLYSQPNMNAEVLNKLDNCKLRCPQCKAFHFGVYLRRNGFFTCEICQHDFQVFTLNAAQKIQRQRLIFS